MARLPRPEDLSRLKTVPFLGELSHAVRGTKDRALRAFLRRSGPGLDASPVEGGRGEHPLGRADLPEFDAGPLAGLGQAALAAGRGEPAAVDAALAFIANDRPGEGGDWSDPGEVACRLIHLAAIAAWSRPTHEASTRFAGSARAHAAWLQRERPFDDADPAVTLGHAALVIAGCTWPALEGARDWRGQGLAGLRHSAVALIGEDGPPARCEPVAAARALWALALARAWARRASAALPSEATGALIMGSTALWRLVGDTGALPDTGAHVPGLLPLGPLPLSASLRDLCLAAGLDQGARGSDQADPAVLRLEGRLPEGGTEPMGPDGDWELWSWRGAGVAVAHSHIKDQASRVVYRQYDGRVQWDLDGQPLLWGSSGPGQLSVARRDGAKARIIALPLGSDPFAEERPERDLLLRQARIVVSDRGLDRISWTLAPGLELQDSGKGEWEAAIAGRTLVVKLDDEGWSWTVQGRSIEGMGDPAVIVRSIFELR